MSDELRSFVTNDEYGVPNHISISMGHSNALLDRIDNFGPNDATVIAAAAGKPVFYFNRIRTFPEGVGKGTIIMEHLVKLLDEHNIVVYCELNPYGAMRHKVLERFYKKYGFEDYGIENTLIRLPKEENSNERYVSVS